MGLKNCTLARVWRQRCSCCHKHNCSKHNNRNCPVSGKITPAEVTVSSWGSVCVPGPCPRLQRQRWQWAWLKRQQASSNFHLTASLLKRPFASAGNATSEPSVSQREHRKRYRTFALRNLGATLPGQVVHTCPVPLMLQLYGAIEIWLIWLFFLNLFNLFLVFPINFF